MSYTLTWAGVILATQVDPEGFYYVGAENGWSATGNAREIHEQMGEAPGTLFGIAQY